MLPDQHPLIGRVYRPGGAPCAIDDLPLVRALKHGEERGGGELIVEQSDGQRVPVLVTSVPLRAEDGTLQGAVAVFQDLRQLHEVERLKSDFVALVSRLQSAEPRDAAAPAGARCRCRYRERQT